MSRFGSSAFAYVFAGLFVVTSGCRTSSPEARRTATEERAEAVGGEGTSAAPDALLLQGRVDGFAAQRVNALRISLYRLDDEGHFIEVEGSQTRTDARGRYELQVVPPSEGPVNLVVVAEDDEAPGRGMAMVPSWAEVDGVMIAPNIDVETAVETEVYLEAVRRGLWIPHLGANELRSMVSGRLASAIRSSRDASRDLPVIAEAAVAAVDAWYRALLDPSTGLLPEQVRGAFVANAWAQVTLDAQIYSAEDANQVNRARSNHARNVAAAYATLGVSSRHLALAGQSAADVLRSYAAQLSPKSRPVLVSEAELLRARCVTGAIDALLDEVNAPRKERAAVREAGRLLSGRLVSAADQVDAEDRVALAWREYEREVRNRLEAVSEDQERDRAEEAREGRGPRVPRRGEPRGPKVHGQGTLALELGPVAPLAPASRV